jgi:translocation and assembly module TamA
VVKDYKRNEAPNVASPFSDCPARSVWFDNRPVTPTLTLFDSRWRIFLNWLLLCSLWLMSGSLLAQDAVPEPPANSNGKLTVLIDGLEEPLRGNALAMMDINRFADQTAPDEIRLNWLHANADPEIRQALEPFGYYEPTIESSLEQTANGWKAHYRVQPGRPLPIAEVDVRILGEGAQDPVFQKLLDHLPLAKGQTLDQPRYEQLKASLESLATERGYFDAQFVERVIRVDLQAYAAAIRLHYDTGPRYRFGDITFKQHILSPKFLNRYPRFKPGDPYDVRELLKLQGDLNNSAYFSQVEVNASPDAATDTTPVEVELEPNRKHRYSAGLGYGTDTGARGKLKVERRWINRHGHHYNAELQFSQIKALIGVKYLIPGEDPTTDEYAITAGYIQHNYNQQDYETWTLGGGWRMQDGKWVKNYSLNFQYEQFQTGSEPRANSLLLIPGLNWTWVDADDRVYPKRGLLFGFGLRGATTALLSDINFLQGTLNLKAVYALNDDNRFIARGDFGATVMTDDFADLPTSLRFFTGGDASVRGYAYNSIGPVDKDDVVTGGKNLLVGSLEYERRVWGDWSVAAFIDSGDAFDGATPNLKTGAGLGVRWRSPVGPVRVDFASGLDRPPGDAFRFSLSIGPDL